MATPDDFGTRLESMTDAYLSDITACMEALPTFLHAYQEDRDHESILTEIETLESQCDQHNQRITRFITDATPRDIGLLNTRINFNESALLDFFNTIDVIVNHTERFAQEVHMMKPASEADVFADLESIAVDIVQMITQFTQLVMEFIAGLTTGEDATELGDHIREIKQIESRCDHARNNIIQTVFEEPRQTEPLIYRELATLLDKVPNTIEDVGDQILIIANDEPNMMTDITDRHD